MIVNKLWGYYAFYFFDKVVLFLSEHAEIGGGKYLSWGKISAAKYPSTIALCNLWLSDLVVAILHKNLEYIFNKMFHKVCLTGW